MTIERLNQFRRDRIRLHGVPPGYEDVTAYIAGIQEPYMRRLFELRYLRGYSWAYVGFIIGNSEENTRQMALRFLKAGEYFDE